MGPLRLLFLLFIIVSSSSSSVFASKVKLEIYYETLCPYCSNLIVNYLYKIFDSDVISITDLKFIPYGNAKIGPNGTITCQHGPNECLLNTVEACAIDAWPDVLELIYAAETSALQPPHKYVLWVVVDGQPLYDVFHGSSNKFHEYGEPCCKNHTKGVICLQICADMQRSYYSLHLW